MHNILKKTKEILQLRNYSPRTQKTYLSYISKYIIFTKESKYNNKEEAIKQFLLNKFRNKQSPQTINLALNSIRFLYTNVLKDKKKIDIKFAKRNKKLPIVLSNTEIKNIIQATNKLKI